MSRLLMIVLAAGALSGCASVPKVTVMAERPGCSAIARAFLAEAGAPLTAEQVLAGVEACEARDRLGAVRLDINQPRR